MLIRPAENGTGGLMVTHLPEDVFPGIRPVRRGRLGFESYGGDPLAEWVLDQAKHQNSGQRDFLALDIGGGTGFRAADLVKKAGFDVLIIDCEKELDWIETRNEILARETKTKRRIDLLHSKIQDIDGPKLTQFLAENYEGRSPSIVTAYNVVHFLDSLEVAALFKTVSQSAAPGSIFALSYKLVPGSYCDNDRKRLHDAEGITKIAKAWGFDKETEIVEANREGVGQGFRLNRNAQSFNC